MSQTKVLMILGAGPMQRSAYVEAREAGIEIIAVDPNPNSVCFTLANHQYQADLSDIETLIKIAESHSINGVMTLAADYPIPAVGQLNEILGLPGTDLSTAKCATDKALMKKKFAELVTDIDWAFMGVSKDSKADVLDETAEKMKILFKDRPGIIKPIDSSGGRGVTYIDPDCKTSDIVLAISNAFHHSPSGRVIGEPYISGKEFSAEIIVHNGRVHIPAITEKITSEAPFFLETGHNLPAQLGTKVEEKINTFTQNLIAGMGLDNSAAHLEFKLQCPNKALPTIVPIEIGARLGGGYINSHLVPMATGINIVKAAVDIAVGNTPQLKSDGLTRGSAIRFLIPPAGQIRYINNIDSISKLPGVNEFFCNYQIGETIDTIRDATGRKAYVICSGKDVYEAADRADNALNHIQFVME